MGVRTVALLLILTGCGTAGPVSLTGTWKGGAAGQAVQLWTFETGENLIQKFYDAGGALQPGPTCKYATAGTKLSITCAPTPVVDFTYSHPSADTLTLQRPEFTLNFIRQP